MDSYTSADTQASVRSTDVDREDARRKVAGAILLAVALALIVLWLILTQTAVVPDLTGLSDVKARHALRDSSLMTGDTTEVRSRRHPAGTVVAQAPSAGTRVMKGSEISFAVAARAGAVSTRDAATNDGSGLLLGGSLPEDDSGSGSAPSGQETPRAAGVAQSVPMAQALTEREAIDRLRAAGYRVRVEYGPVTSGPAKGRVYFQDPEPDALEPAGTLVEIWVSTGGVKSGGSPYPSPTSPGP